MEVINNPELKNSNGCIIKKNTVNHTEPTSLGPAQTTVMNPDRCDSHGCRSSYIKLADVSTTTLFITTWDLINWNLSSKWFRDQLIIRTLCETSVQPVHDDVGRSRVELRVSAFPLKHWGWSVVVPFDRDKPHLEEFPWQERRLMTEHALSFAEQMLPRAGGLTWTELARPGLTSVTFHHRHPSTRQSQSLSWENNPAHNPHWPDGCSSKVKCF